MMELPTYTLGAEAIGTYLADIERRWGIRLAFTLSQPRSSETQAPFVVWLKIAHESHKLEIPWFDDMLVVPDTNTQIDLVSIMWDMLYVADQVLHSGPAEL